VQKKEFRIQEPEVRIKELLKEVGEYCIRLKSEKRLVIKERIRI